MDPNQKRLDKINCQKRASIWLTTLPLKEERGIQHGQDDILGPDQDSVNTWLSMTSQTRLLQISEEWLKFTTWPRHFHYHHQNMLLLSYIWTSFGGWIWWVFLQLFMFCTGRNSAEFAYTSSNAELRSTNSSIMGIWIFQKFAAFFRNEDAICSFSSTPETLLLVK